MDYYKNANYIDYLREYVETRDLRVTEDSEDAIAFQITPVGERPVCFASIAYYDDMQELKVRLTDLQEIDPETELQLLQAVNDYNRRFGYYGTGVAIVTAQRKYLVLDFLFKVDEDEYAEDMIGELLIDVYRSWLNLVELVPDMGTLKTEFSKN